MKLLIFGNGDIANLAFVNFKNQNRYKISGFVLDKKFINKNKHNNLPIFAYETLLATHPPKNYKLFIGLGLGDLNLDRKKVFIESQNYGYELVNCLTKNCAIYSSNIGINNLILDNVVIQPFCKLGDNNIIAPNSVIGHNSVLGSHNYIGPNVSLCGFNEVESLNFIGANSTVSGHVKIRNSNYLGPSVNVFSDIKSNKTILNKNSNILKINSLSFIRLIKKFGMNIEKNIKELFLEIFTENNPTLTPPTLTKDLTLLNSGLDSLALATLVIQLEDKLGYDPFIISSEPFYPRTFGEFVDFYLMNKPDDFTL